MKATATAALMGAMRAAMMVSTTARDLAMSMAVVWDESMAQSLVITKELGSDASKVPPRASQRETMSAHQSAEALAMAMVLELACL